jgi:hypothetical protein
MRIASQARLASVVISASLVFATIGCGGGHNQPDAATAPSITSIAPNPLCSDGMTLTIVGMNFAPGATVTIDGVTASATVVDSMHISVTVPANTIMTGSNAIVVTNPDGQTAMGTLNGEKKPLMFFVDPNVLGANMTARVTVYMSSLTTTVTSVSVQPHAGGATTQLTNVAAVTSHPNQIQATVTGGTLSAGTYDVSVTDGVCSATLPNGLTIVGTPDITITDVQPPFGDPTKDTAISITTSGYPLKQTPRVYLSNGTTATGLSAVVWQSATSVSAVVPANALAAGAYDVIVIDPIDANGGHVGVLANGFRLIANPPVIDSVTPTTVTATVTTPLAVTGSGFATGATPTAYFTQCTAPAGVALPTLPFALPAISGATSTALTVTVNANSIPASAACVLRIINGTATDPAKPCPIGGTCLPYVDFSAIAFVTGSGNLGTWTQSTGGANDPVKQLPAARTRLGVVAGHATSQARFLYQASGDDGTLSHTSSTVMSTQLDPLGNLLGWTAQSNSLVAARTGAAVIRIGQFIYAIGGSTDGSAALATVERARILDPLDVPAVPGIDLTPSATGLGAGAWVYRITGVRASTYASDPSGETLPSDPLNVTLPDLSAMTGSPLVEVSLSWPAMANVASYNIYRTSTVGQNATQVQLIGNVPQPTGTTVTFDDTGLTTTAQSPLPIGATGKWHAVSSLTTARFGVTAAIAQGPSNTTTSSIYLYVAGGGSDTTLGTATLLDTYEWAKVDIMLADGSQTVGAFAVGRNTANTANQSIGGARAFAQSFAVDSTLNSAVTAGTSFVYFGSGAKTGFLPISAMDVGSVTTAGTSGDLGTLATASASAMGGSAYVTITGFMFTLGGVNNGGTLQNTTSTSMCPDGNGCTASPPTLTTWKNGGGGTPNVPRIFSTALVEGPFIYLFGGSTNATGSNATQSVERAVF